MTIKTEKVGALEYLVAENLSAGHGFTTRFGGVSQGHLASMNIGTHRGDDPENVRQNYEILGRAIGFDPQKLVLTKQTHTDNVAVVGKSQWGAGLFAPELRECDGLITNTPGTALVVFTADCTPVLLHDPVTGAVGAVHAGWRGTAADIVGKAVEKMADTFGCRRENIQAAIGPNIAQCCFETDGDVPKALVKTYGEGVSEFVRPQGYKYYVNLKGVNAFALRRAGVRDISIAPHCTRCDPDRFWSHRRVGQNRGSQGAIIVCKEVGL